MTLTRPSSPLSLTRLTTSFMPVMVVVSRADSPTTWAPSASAVVDEALRRHVGAEVDDLEAGALEHDAHQVLADVVQVALDRADDHLAQRADLAGDEQRLDEVHARVHGARREQHLGQEDLVGAEARADDVHAREQAVVEDLACRQPGIERLPGQLRDLLVLSTLQALADLLQNVHLIPPRIAQHYRPLGHPPQPGCWGWPEDAPRASTRIYSGRSPVPGRRRSEDERGLDPVELPHDLVDVVGAADGDGALLTASGCRRSPARSCR